MIPECFRTTHRSRRLVPLLARVLVAPACAVVIAGCSVSLLPDKQPQRIFDLPYTALEPPGGETNRVPALQVNLPRARGVHDGNRLLIEIQPNELAAYEGVRWVTDAPVLLRERLVRSLRQDPRMSHVASDESGAATALMLTSSLQAFQEDRTGNRPAARIYLQAQLVENDSRQILAAKDFQASRIIEGDTLAQVVRAFGDATAELAAALADWIAANAPRT